MPGCRQICQVVGKCARLLANVPGCRRICQAARLQAAGDCARSKLKGPVTGVETSNWGKNGEEMHRCIVDSSAVDSRAFGTRKQSLGSRVQVPGDCSQKCEQQN